MTDDLVEVLRRALLAGAGSLSLAAVCLTGFGLSVAAKGQLTERPQAGAGQAAQAAGEAASIDPLLARAQAFRRPVALPFDQDRPSPARVRLGEALFGDTRLSGTGTHSCASCHDPLLGFADGVPVGAGATGKRLERHTPTLWNLAWGESFFWDGRAATLEAQARGPIEHPSEMAGSLSRAAVLLSEDSAARQQFEQAFPGENLLEPGQILRALAAYERTIVSPQTRFDRWVGGDPSALDDRERAGFALFTGKAGCVDCHSGWAFTDRAFHDIGLPGQDRGRFAILGLDAADHAFRTPGLRELAWTAPYMHDGSLATLEDVLDHYEKRVIARPSLSPDLPKIRLTADERRDLLAFLATLSSEIAPVPSAPDTASAPTMPTLETARQVRQKDKQFSPAAVRLPRGETLTIVNDDTRTHNVRWDGDGAFNSGAQEPGQTVTVTFPGTGTFQIYCGIHPAMRLTVDIPPP